MIDPSIRLRRAIHLHDLVLVQRIVKGNPHTLPSPDIRANTALHLAASLGAVDIAVIAPILILSAVYCLLTALLKEFLIDAGHEDERISRNIDGATPLMEAVEVGCEAAAQLIAARFPRCIEWQDKNGMDAIMKAARVGSSSLITAFLALSDNPTALISATDADGSTALHYASANGHLKCVITLMQEGANPAARNTFSWAPVSYSSTVSAEVYFKSLVTELERKKGEQREREREMDRRREGGLRVVGEDDWELGRDATREVLANVDAGRTTPTGVRASGWGLSGRIRAGSTE